MLNKIKIAGFLALAVTFNLSAGESNQLKSEKSNAVIEQLETKAKKCLSPKKQKKLMGKLKQNLNEKKDEIVAQIADSKLSDSQKVSLVEALETAEAELN